MDESQAHFLMDSSIPICMNQKAEAGCKPFDPECPSMQTRLCPSLSSPQAYTSSPDLREETWGFVSRGGGSYVRLFFFLLLFHVCHSKWGAVCQRVTSAVKGNSFCLPVRQNGRERSSNSFSNIRLLFAHRDDYPDRVLSRKIQIHPVPCDGTGLLTECWLK